jgi:hypothetical protein
MQEKQEPIKTEQYKPKSPEFLEDQSSIVESHIVIKDPETNEILISRRD